MLPRAEVVSASSELLVTNGVHCFETQLVVTVARGRKGLATRDYRRDMCPVPAT